MDGKIYMDENDIDQSPKIFHFTAPSSVDVFQDEQSSDIPFKLIMNWRTSRENSEPSHKHRIHEKWKTIPRRSQKRYLKDIFRERGLDGTATRGLLDDQSPTIECNNNAVPPLWAWRGNQSLKEVKVKKDIVKDKKLIIFKFTPPLSINEEEDDLVQTPEIKFKFTDLVSIDEEEDDLDQSQTVNLSGGEVEETENPGTVPRTEKQSLLRLRTDIFKDGVVSFSSLDTLSSLTFSSIGISFLQDSVISSTPSHGPRDFNNSQPDDQIMLEDRDLNGISFLQESVIFSRLRDFNLSQSEYQIMLEDRDLRRQLRKKQRLEDRKLEDMKLEKDVRSLSEGIVEKRRKIAQLEEEIISDQSELDRKEKLRISRQKEENQPNRYCDLCNVKANGEITWQDHLNGKKHRMRKLELEEGGIVIL